MVLVGAGLRGAFGIERQQLRQDLVVAQIMRPSVGGEQGDQGRRALARSNLDGDCTSW